ncbi:MAG: GIY-YIG nuclease family protein, partial [Bacteroidales bacterium]|nr:GIY-YIG nuclease family protein [Bacteroidales bacterium]
MFYIYFLYSQKHDRYYVGHTDNVTRSVEEHNNNPRLTYTHKFGPWVLKAAYPVGTDRGDALKVERFIKKQKSRKLLEELTGN